MSTVTIETIETTETIDDYQFVTSGIQLAVNDYYDSHKYLSDEAIDHIIDTFWHEIPPDMEEITIDHPSIQDALIVIEFNPDYDEEYDEDEDNYPYSINRVYSNLEDEDRDEEQIESGYLHEIQILSRTSTLTASRSSMTACC